MAGSDLFAPVTGEVVEVNPELASKPEIVNQDPHDRGWLVRLPAPQREQTLKYDGNGSTVANFGPKMNPQP